MPKTVLITGSTDGIGLATARMLLDDGHRVLLHGRNPAKLQGAIESLKTAAEADRIDGFTADLSSLKDTAALAGAVAEKYDALDALINNAGVLKLPDPVTPSGLDARIVVNTIAPYLLAMRLLPLLRPRGRVVNVSSAAQAPVELRVFTEMVQQDDMAAYSQSKLAITMWSRHLAADLGDSGPVVIAVNPGSLLGSKMVKDGFGIAGGDIGIGAEILRRAALDPAFAGATGRYFDNDAGDFGPPHRDAMDERKCSAVVAAIEKAIASAAE